MPRRTPAQRRRHIERLRAHPLLTDNDRWALGHIGNRVTHLIVVDGKAYFVLTEPRCHVCTSPYRGQVEWAVWENLMAFRVGSSRGVVGGLPADAGISWRSVRRHVWRRHTPMLTILRDEAVNDAIREMNQLSPRIPREKWYFDAPSGTFPARTTSSSAETDRSTSAQP